MKLKLHFSPWKKTYLQETANLHCIPTHDVCQQKGLGIHLNDKTPHYIVHYVNDSLQWQKPHRSAIQFIKKLAKNYIVTYHHVIICIYKKREFLSLHSIHEKHEVHALLILHLRLVVLNMSGFNMTYSIDTVSA